MDHAASKLYHIDGWGGFEKPPPDAQIRARLKTMAGTEDDKVQRRLDSYKGQYTGVADLFSDVYRIDGTPFITVTIFLYLFLLSRMPFFSVPPICTALMAPPFITVTFFFLSLNGFFFGICFSV